MSEHATPLFEDVEVASALADLVKGPLTTAHLMRWSAAIENWHKIHYDLPFATEHDKLPGLMVNGSLKQQFLIQLLKDWAGPRGWLWKAAFQFRAMDLAGDTLAVRAKVTGKRRTADFGLVDLEIGIWNDGRNSTPGTATVALPYRDGPAVPYPFPVPIEKSRDHV